MSPLSRLSTNDGRVRVFRCETYADYSRTGMVTIWAQADGRL